MRKTILIAATLFASPVAIPAAAQTIASARSVAYADLNLDHAADRAQLDRRIAAAIEDVCGSYAGAASHEMREIDRCRQAARHGIETRIADLRTRRAQVALGSR